MTVQDETPAKRYKIQASPGDAIRALRLRLLFLSAMPNPDSWERSEIRAIKRAICELEKCRFQNTRQTFKDGDGI